MGEDGKEEWKRKGEEKGNKGHECGKMLLYLWVRG